MSIAATATFTNQLISPGVFSYTITLNNTGDTTIGTFWFAWDDVPDQDFMSVQPTNIGQPTGWTDLVTSHFYSGVGTGYGIEWINQSNPLAPGNSFQFTFQSTETPAEMAGDSIFDPTFPVASAFVYIGGAFGDPGFQLTATPTCFCRGTMIQTESGEVTVEDLAIGDRVMTLSGEARPIKWIGHRTYDRRFVARNPAVWPICVAAGALADGVPARDLLVTPEHSFYFDGVLVPVRHLVNGATIAPAAPATVVERVEIFHIEFDTHDIVFAEGAPAESYVDCDNRGMFQNAAEFALLYPDDDRPRWQFCAPLLQWDSDEANPIREALMQRAEAIGHKLDLDPDLHLIVDGAVVRPECGDGRVYHFTVPTGCAAASLASRSAIPAEIRATARDLRRLGVPVERLVLYDADLWIEAEHSHAGLSEGFHEDEPGHRWTDGLGRLPESWLRPFPGEFTLEVHLVATDLSYRLHPPPARATAAARSSTRRRRALAIANRAK